ncbi:MAG: penicillin-binding protein 2 [Deltaproteobacteria bacterium]|nr:penicillin-binding protein 2 [Deltaproteobacteria bacterium]MBK8719675.1 penicillin-binding protein 2 [Deltaproteobacteria bacterium]MBP7289629.1 penicillin-binding protein 2 [Nannocystaceae bacterium]
MIDLRQPDNLRELRSRFSGMVLVVFLVFSGLMLRLCQLQVLEGEHYARRAERNFVDVVDVEAPRGRIFDIQGRPVATNRPAYTLYFTAWTRFRADEDGGISATEDGERESIDDETVELLASLFDFVDDEDRAQTLGRIEELRGDEDRGRHAQILRRNLGWDEFARLQARLGALDPWIEIRESSRRFYPEGELTGFVTGHMGNIDRESLERSDHLSYRPGDRVGQTGIERMWENYLRGRLGSRSRVVDAARREVAEPTAEALAALPPDRDPIPGQDIYLTLDLDLQRVAHDAVAAKLAGAVVALEADTGRVLAMVSVPGVDPNRYEQPIPGELWRQWSESPLKPFIDKTVQEHFFPGSTYKVVSALAALSDPEFDPDAEIECTGSVLFGGRRFKDTHVHGNVDLEHAIIQSCNTYFYTLAMRNTLSLERVEQFARALGLGERSGLGINGEVKGTIPTEEFEAREGTYQGGVRLNSAIGQGNVKVTVMQLAVVYAALANGGRVMTPYLVDRIETNEGKLVLANEPKPRNEAPVINAYDRERIHRGLVGVVNDPSGTAYSERLANVVVAGKTGTAQVGRESANNEIEIAGWDTTEHHAWFAAYAPAEAPRIVVVAVVEHGGTGADAAAPIVMKVIDHYLGSTTSETGERPRGFGVPPPLPGRPDADPAAADGDGKPGERRDPTRNPPETKPSKPAQQPASEPALPAHRADTRSPD